jgi:hypothetical protein
MQGSSSSATQALFSIATFQTNRTNEPIRPTVPLRYVPHRRVRNPLVSSSVATTVESVAASSAGNTRQTKSGLTNLRDSIPKVSGIAPAIVVTALSVNGNTFGQAVPTAIALVAASRL